MTRDLTRRGFVATAGGAVGLALIPELGNATQEESAPPASPVGSTILFQGDSITDCGRDRGIREPNTIGGIGPGYPLLASAPLLKAHPDRGYQFFNRGVSGNRIPDLVERWTADTLDLKPDILSILIGVNDFWHKLLRGATGTVEDYESGYGELLETTQRALPQIRIIVLEPFVLRTGVVDERWFPEFDLRRAAAARVADRAKATFVPLQEMFDRLSRKAAPAFWSADGVHPTPAGHAAIAEIWRSKAKI
jgi:lysophospholipase L1-like esterase